MIKKFESFNEFDPWGEEDWDEGKNFIVNFYIVPNYHKWKSIEKLANETKGVEQIKNPNTYDGRFPFIGGCDAPDLMKIKFENDEIYQEFLTNAKNVAGDSWGSEKLNK